MKKIILLLAIFLITGVAKAERIPREAWNNLRDIHAWHLQNVDGIPWNPKTADTDAFLKDTIKPYFFSLVEKNKELTDQNQKLIKERDEALADVQSKNLILTIFVFIILGTVVIVIGWLFLSSRSAKRNRPTVSTDKLHCPRCGAEHGADETICKNCKTHF